ncbi:acyl-CoA dehydrogenase family protein [Nakamurella leprariae]|uniref:Acyl-CoA dehydrogenase family protein n=1 Tax=Nakamurella leprariae TaxID=2803911 RepID=A0A938YAP5_9ACTN|nr:acyl-CoA dehydrogenase family protein [Nakamurella leprariae]MBM9469051.1 acyl-CoA dehydrogenase family protein [Nakamurella leprariae]
MSVDLTLDPRIEDLKQRTRSFIDEHVIPAESEIDAHGAGLADDRLAALRTVARRAGIFAPTAPEEFGGLALDHRDQSVVLEESGRSVLGPAVLNCAAPDEGNILLLDKKTTPQQREQYLAPLARGEVRSAFSMTEPSPGAGADPEMLATTATKVDGGWRIDGRKWLITGADGAAFFITMARTSERAATMFLVDAGHPGMTISRHVTTLDSGFAGGHGELIYDHCVVPDSAVLGRVDEGFADAQVRLGPARLTHCMRWLGAARRAHEVAVAYATARPMFGGRLADQGMAQEKIADNEIDIQASRLMIWNAAAVLDRHEPARQETSTAKVFVAEAVNRIVDRSVQLCGGYGVSYDSPLPHILREVRPFRIYDGPSEVHRRAISRRAVRRSESGSLPGDYS